MRSFLVALALFGLALPASAAGFRIVRVWPGYRDAASFEHISEFFTGRENPGHQLLLRTRPDSRDGFYFLVRLANPGTPLTGVKLSLQVLKPDAGAQPQTYTFTAALRTGDTVCNLGLTGADWPGPRIHPVAWKLDVLAPDGHLLATRQSYLWSYPEKGSGP